jgi:hypothetical protein
MKYIVYTHTDYLDIINVHSNNLKFSENILLINNNDYEIDYIYEKFSKVIFYDDDKSYAEKLIQCISNIDDEYFILVHDMDILIDLDKNKMDEIINYVISKDIHRLYLHHFPHLISSRSEIIDLNSFEKVTDSNIPDDIFYRINTPNDISSGYGVNPSICKKSAMLDIWSKFSYKTYRNIENIDVGTYCIQNYNFYMCMSKNPINVGHYSVMNFFKFIHITHGGQLLTADKEGMNEDVREHYIKKILNKYEFKR